MTSLRQIAHLDLDCFFVSVERIKNPSLNGKPVVVGGTPGGRGVVASASYEARKFGVRSAMPTSRAIRLCPNLIVVPGSHGEYGKYSDRLYKRLCELAPVVERASIDEMNLDFTGCEALYGNDLPGFMKNVQKLVWDELRLPCTIALASNKTLAKIAANTVKPNGVIIVPHGTEKSFLAPLPVGTIPGVGKKTEELLHENGFRQIADLQKLTREKLTAILGRHGGWIFEVANGSGSYTVHPEISRQSISREQTFSHDIPDIAEMERRLFPLVEDVCATVRKKSCKAGTVSLKLRYADFKTITRASSIEPTNDDTVVSRTVRELLRDSYRRKMAVRLLGVALSNLVEVSQTELDLFPDVRARQDMLSAVNEIRKKFGQDVIHVGGV